MKRTSAFATGLLLAGLSGLVGAAGIPKPGPDDPRVRVMNYSPMGVTQIKVRRGTGTRIVLAADERISDAAPGFSSDCKSPTDEWCIAAPIGGNQIFVRPRDNAQTNNLEIRTDKRDYSLEFLVMPDEVPGKKTALAETPYYRVIFEYPKPPAPEQDPEAIRKAVLMAVQATSLAPTGAPGTDKQARAQLKQQLPGVRNSSYTMQVLEKGEDAAPSMVFDDGRFTYFEFSGNREIPAVFAFGSDEQPTRVNWHMESPFIVVHRTARKFVLRLGAAVVGVYNEAFDQVGIDTPAGTTVDGVVREAKEADKEARK